MNKIQVGVNGCGVIGKRVADAILLQPDMELVGVADIATDWRIKSAANRLQTTHPSGRPTIRMPHSGTYTANSTAHSSRSHRVRSTGTCSPPMKRSPSGSNSTDGCTGYDECTGSRRPSCRRPGTAIPSSSGNSRCCISTGSAPTTPTNTARRHSGGTATSPTVWPGEPPADPVEDFCISDRGKDFVQFVHDDVAGRREAEIEFYARTGSS